MRTEILNKMKLLQSVKERLKEEFVGIDDIIDNVITSITPWFLTPEIMERPTVISLWGLTGTGKTSLIKKLTGYLELSSKSYFFDCGEQGGGEFPTFTNELDNLKTDDTVKPGDLRFSDSDLEFISKENSGVTISPNMSPCIFVFDEFQYLKTKDEDNKELLRPEIRGIWGLIDSGLLDINRGHYMLSRLIDYLDELDIFISSNPGIKVRDFRFPKDLRKKVKDQLSYHKWDSDPMSDEEVEEDSKGGQKLLYSEEYSYLLKSINKLSLGLGNKLSSKLLEVKTLEEFVKLFRRYVNLINRPRLLNFSNSLIFILGNLDEAFGLSENDLDPDISADSYREITERVNIIDIKRALRKRFRDEQIGRLGNNVIIYPSLREVDFKEVISRETSRIVNNPNYPKITVSEKFKALIYSEGVFPMQGVRPIFSTINTVISPLISTVVSRDIKEDVIFDVEGNIDSEKIELVILSASGECIEKIPHKLNLGALKSPDRCKKIGLQAVHEASHSVLYTMLTGELPSAIVASGVFGDGGYMMDKISNDFSTNSIEELEQDIIVSLAGYYGEREFFESDKCSLGAGSDIQKVWENLSSAYYDCGLVLPLKLTPHKSKIEQMSLLPLGFSDEEMIKNTDKKILDYFSYLCEKTKRLVERYKSTIACVSMCLVEKRSIGTSEFESLLRKNGLDIPKPVNEAYYIEEIKKNL